MNANIKNIFSIVQPSVALTLIFTIVLWSASLTAWFNTAHAAQLTSVSDTLSNSNVSSASNHTIQLTTKNAISASSTIVVDFPDSFQSTSTAFAITDPLDYDMSTTTSRAFWVYAAGGCTAAATTTSAFEISSITSANIFTFTHCANTPTVAASSAITIKLGTHATQGGGTGDSQLINSSGTASYVVTITAPAGDSADMRIALLPTVTVTASVDTTLTFTVSGVASGSANANGEAGTTDVTTTSTSIPFGTLAAGVAKVARQDLAVATNAKNGFTVTIIEDQDLTSNNGATIRQFVDAVISAPQVWASPTGTIDSPSTWGHLGVTTEDSTLSGGDTFGAALYEGIATSTPLEIFYHTNPANGVTADKGATKIGFKIEINALQPAANDYTNTLTYVATPIF